VLCQFMRLIPLMVSDGDIVPYIKIVLNNTNIYVIFLLYL